METKEENETEIDKEQYIAERWEQIRKEIGLKTLKEALEEELETNPNDELLKNKMDLFGYSNKKTKPKKHKPKIDNVNFDTNNKIEEIKKEIIQTNNEELKNDIILDNISNEDFEKNNNIYNKENQYELKCNKFVCLIS